MNPSGSQNITCEDRFWPVQPAPRPLPHATRVRVWRLHATIAVAASFGVIAGWLAGRSAR